ncbi:MAG: tryptophan synthase subunit alpha [Deltaproteobacteria bacterium]|jgi:tryptophan synthase alpha chain|nr:tryptophan synthase subunit alpha [Deltaproteobacteria bacterium]
MSRITNTFTRLKQRGETALIPFITAGDPDLAMTAKLVRTLEASGADLIELGMPFSDPMADGPTIQAASERALEAGTTLKKVLGLVADIRQHSQIPLVLMGYYNPIFCYGPERFIQDAAAAGVDALLLVDLPPEEAAEISSILDNAGIALITLLAPTTPPERMKQLAKAAQGYLYYVSMTGVTGAKKITPEDISAAVTTLKEMSPVPVGVGFGISTVEEARAVGEFADGVVVGSALVKIIAEHGQSQELLPEVAKYISGLKQGLAAVN